MTILSERDTYAYNYAGYLANKMILSLSPNLISYHSREDLQSEIVLYYLENIKNKLDDREKGWKGYIQRSCRNYMYAFIRRQKQGGESKVSLEQLREKQGDSFELENSLGCFFNEIFSLELEDIDMIINIEVIKELCGLFKVEFSPHNPTESLKEILDLTLNQYDNETFKRIPIQIQKQLLDLGEAVDAKKLEISVMEFREEKKKRNFKEKGGLMGKIRRLINNNPNIKTSEIFERLDKEGIVYKKLVVYSSICQIKKKRKELGFKEADA